MKAELVKRQDRWDLYGEDGSKIASSAPNPFKRLSIKNCEAIENGYDLEEISSSLRKEFEIKYNTGKGIPVEGGGYIIRGLDYQVGVIDGFQKAIELLGDKKFSKEDVISMIEKSRETGLTAEYLILTKQQNEWDVEIVLEVINHGKGEDGLLQETVEPKLDADGCLILKRK